MEGIDLKVLELWRYPVKSLLGERLDRVAVDSRGIVGDRVFAVRDRAGKFGSGKTTRRFRRLAGLFDLSAETVGERVLVHAPDGGVLPVGDPALDRFFTMRYHEPLAVVREGNVSHFDAGPLHLITTASLAWVDSEYGSSAGDPRRYRPNIVIETAAVGLVENNWIGSELAIGSCVLRVTGPCERCVMPTATQAELPQLPQLLSFLGHRNGNNLGVYACVVRPGWISRWDRVSLTWRSG